MQNITPELATALHLGKDKGALVSQVVPKTPAATAGLQAQDVILKVNDHSISGAVQLRNIMGLIRPGTPAHITFMRNNVIKTTTATVADPKKLKSDKTPYFSGMRLQDLTELEKDGAMIHGVLITDVSDSSEGALAGIQIGDVITAINGKAITSVQTLQEEAKNQTQPLLLSIVRNNQNVYLVLNAE